MELITKISSITTTQNYIALRLYLLPSYCLKIAPSIIEIRLKVRPSTDRGIHESGKFGGHPLDNWLGFSMILNP
jgi:hypothetical protein